MNARRSRGFGPAGLFAAVVLASNADVACAWTALDATYLGGWSSDKVLAVTSDAAGNTYVAGLTQSFDFPVLNAAQPIFEGAADAFVAKINPTGSAIVWSTFLGGSGIDAALGIARDAAGNVYVTGYTGSTDFPITPNAPQPSFGGGAYDAFVAKLDANGALLQSTFLGGADLDVANAIAVDAAGGAHVAGFTCSADFPIVAAFQSQLVGLPVGCFSAQDAFIAELAPNGVSWTQVSYYGGAGKDAANAIVVDPQGRTAIAGVTALGDLPAAGIPLMGAKGGGDAFVARFASGMPEYLTYFGGGGDDIARGLATDATGALYLTGSTTSFDFPAVAAWQPSLHGLKDAFAAKLLVSGDPPASATIAWSTYLGGRSDDIAYAIAIEAGAAYIAGETASVNFPLAGAFQGVLGGPVDAFVARFAPNGDLSFSSYFGGIVEDAAYGIALSNGALRARPRMHLGGITYSEADIATPGAFQPEQHGGSDGFVAHVRSVP